MIDFDELLHRGHIKGRNSFEILAEAIDYTWICVRIRVVYRHEVVICVLRLSDKIAIFDEGSQIIFDQS